MQGRGALFAPGGLTRWSWEHLRREKVSTRKRSRRDGTGTIYRLKPATPRGSMSGRDRRQRPDPLRQVNRRFRDTHPNAAIRQDSLSKTVSRHHSTRCKNNAVDFGSTKAYFTYAYERYA